MEPMDPSSKTVLTSRQTVGRADGSTIRNAPAGQLRKTSGKVLRHSHLIYGLLLLVLLQVLLLGTSDEIGSGKLVFGGVFVILFFLCTPRLIRYSGRWLSSGVCRWTVLFLALGVFSVLPAAVHGIPVEDWFRDFSSLLNLSVILVAAVLVDSDADFRRLYHLLLAMVVIMTVAITVQYAVLRGFIIGAGEGLSFVDIGAVGFLDFVHVTDSVVLFGFFMASSLALATSGKSRILLLCLTAGFIIAVILTGTRTHIVAIFAGLGFYLWLARGRMRASLSLRRLVPPLASVLLAGALLGVLGYLGVVDIDQLSARYGEAASVAIFEDQTMTNRATEASEAWQAFAANPLVGQGLGYRLKTTSESGTELVNTDSFLVHNYYLYLIAKFGIAGPVVFAGLLAAALRLSITGYRGARTDYHRQMFAGLGSLLVALAVESLTASRFNDRTATLLLGILLGMTVALHRVLRLDVPLPVQYRVPVEAHRR